MKLDDCESRTSSRVRGANALKMLAAAVALSACSAPAGNEPRDNANCNVPGHACTWLGKPGEEGFNGDGHDRRDTVLYWTMDMLFASDGTPWFLDWNNHLVRRVLPDDTVQTVVGWTDPVFPGDGAKGDAEHTAEGALGTEVQLNHPTDLLELPGGDILLMAWHNHKLRRINPSSGRVKTVCGAGPGFKGDGGPAELALFKQPKSLELDEAGNLYILDQQNFRVRAIAPDQTIQTMAGAGKQGNDGDGGAALGASFGFEAGSNPEPSGGLAYRAGKLYVSDTLNNRIRVIDLETHEISAFAGTGERGFSGDGGAALDAEFNHPRDIEFSADGVLYVADTDNSRIRAIDLDSGIVTTIAGTGELGLDASEGKLATETPLKRPFGIAFDATGNLYISDTMNSRIVRVAR